MQSTTTKIDRTRRGEGAANPDARGESLHRGTTGTHCFTARKIDGRYQVEGARDVFLGYGLAADVRDLDARSGVFVRWHWDGSVFTCRNDYSGFYPVYFHASENLFCISNDLLDVTRQLATLTLDDDALAVFLRAGFFLGNATAFRDIQVLPPGSLMRWQAGRLVIERDGPLPPRAAVISRKAAMQDYGELFQATVERYRTGLGEAFSLPLSGGRDSRHILLALLEAGAKPAECLTSNKSGSPWDQDLSVARALCERAGVRHTIIDRRPYSIQREWQKNLLTGMCTDEHAWIMPMLEYVRAHDVRVLFDGIGGDVLSAGLFLNERRLSLFAQGRYWRLAEDILREESNLPLVLNSSTAARWSRERAVAATVEELKRHEGAPNPIGQFYFWNRTRREIALSPWSLFGRHSHVLAPFLDYEVYAFLASLPAGHLLDHQFHTRTLQARYPRFADIPFQQQEARPLASLNERLRFLAGAMRVYGSARAPGGTIKRRYLFKSGLKSLVNAEYGSQYPRLIAKLFYLVQLTDLVQRAGRPR